MILQVYALAWILFASLAGTLYLTGMVEAISLVILGMIAALLAFIGMIVVVPLSVSTSHSREG